MIGVHFKLGTQPVPATLFSAACILYAAWALTGAIIGLAAYHYTSAPFWPSVIIGQIAWEAIVMATRSSR